MEYEGDGRRVREDLGEGGGVEAAHVADAEDVDAAGIVVVVVCALIARLAGWSDGGWRGPGVDPWGGRGVVEDGCEPGGL